MKLSRVLYWRLTTLLPVVVPAVATPLVLVLGSIGVGLPEWIAGGVVVAFMGAFMFLPIYIPLVAAILWLLRARPWEWHAAAAAVAPSLMAALVGIVGSFVAGGTIVESIRLWGAFCLGLGYFYVAVAFVGMWLVARAGGFSGAA